ncbi:MAG: DNA-formamidopyrimidine glycosylase family protein [Acidimicrobiales bacterium]
MPELPEVRAHAERLTTEFSGSILAKVRPLHFAALKTFEPAPGEAVGQTLSEVTTRAKLLILNFGPTSHIVHLMQGGRLRPDEKQSAKVRGGLFRWVFEDDRALLLTEAGTDRKAGVWTVGGDPLLSDRFIALGPDADVVSTEGLAEILGSSSMRLHGLLRKQGHVAGIGRRLANEICHRAKISPFANTSKLGTEQIAHLHVAIAETIAEGLAYERGRDDMSSSKDRPASVHHRKGEKCSACGDEIRQVSYNRYDVNYCATCQTGGKVLADNTTSKFLK